MLKFVRVLMTNIERIYLHIHWTNPFTRGIVITGGTNILLGILGLVTSMLAARLLGPHGRGELAAIQTWPSLIAAVAMLGFPEALVYYSAREPKRAGRYLGSAMVLALLSSCFFMVVGYLSMPLVLSAQSAPVILAARWYLLLVPVFALVGLPYQPLRGLNDFVAWNGLRITPGIAWLGILILAWLLGHASPAFLAFIYLGFLALLFFPVMYVVTQRVSGPFWPAVRHCWPIVRYGAPCMASSVPQMLNFRLDQLLMAALLPAQALGFYVVAVAWSGAVQPLLTAIAAVMFPRVASQESQEHQVQAFAQGVQLGIAIALILAAALLVCTPWAVPLIFGERFTAAIPAAMVLVIAGAVTGVNSVIEESIRGLGHPAAVMWAEFGGLVITAVSLYFLLRPFGIMGAALASLIGYSMVLVFLLVQVQSLLGRDPRMPQYLDLRQFALSPGQIKTFTDAMRK